MASSLREPRAYEFMTILTPELSDEDLTSNLERITGYFTSVGATIKEANTNSPWGRRRLAYTIRFNSVDYRDGIYVLFLADVEPSRVTEIERELRLDTHVMRYLVVHDDPKAGEPESANQPADGEEAASEEAAVETAPAAETATEEVATEAPAEAAEEAVAAAEEPAAADEPAPADEPVTAEEAAPTEEPVAEAASETPAEDEKEG